MIFPDAANISEAPENQLIQRRGVLGTIALAGLGMLAASGKSNAASPKTTTGAVPKISVPMSSGAATNPIARYSTLTDLPEEWSARNCTLLNDYLRYLTALKMQRVCPRQVIQAHAKEKNGVWNTLPPKVWWNRMGYLLRVVDRIAREMNVAQVEIVSAYRAPAYNARCPGARAGSWHQANVAADVKFPVRASKVTATARNLRDLGLFKGGVGGYWNFTHIDARGQNINW